MDQDSRRHKYASGFLFFILPEQPDLNRDNHVGTTITVTNLRLFRWLIRIQATYILVTATRPIIDIESFLAITGPKRDV